jgi:hypothetical protein
MLSVAETAVKRHCCDALGFLATSVSLLPRIADVSKRSIPGALAKCAREVPAVRSASPNASTSVTVSERFEQVPF